MRAASVHLSSDLVLGKTNHGRILEVETRMPGGAIVAAVELLPSGWVVLELTEEDQSTRIALPPHRVSALHGLERPGRARKARADE